MAVIHLTDDERILEVACNVRFEGTPDWTLDKLLLNPLVALQVCSETRRRLPLKLREDLPDERILRLLLNERKRGRKRARRDQTPREPAKGAGVAARSQWPAVQRYRTTGRSAGRA
jgi:hypothetical protein